MSGGRQNPSDGSTKRHRVYISLNVDDRLKERLRKQCQELGGSEIKDGLNRNNGKRYAVVKFNCQNRASEAIAHMHKLNAALEARGLHVLFSLVHQENSTLYVKGIFIDDRSQENLWELFNKKYTGFIDVTRHKKNPYALVDFPDEHTASMAIQQLNKNSNGKKTISFFDSKVIYLESSLTIGQEESYKEFIEILRDVFAQHSCGPSTVGPKPLESQEDLSRPVLPPQQPEKQPHRWINIKLIAKNEDKEWSTTLVIRDDNLYVKGFTGKDDQWLELWTMDDPEETMLPKEYKAKRLRGWGSSYSSMMGLNGLDQAEKTLMESAMLGKSFAERAVRRLSRYDPDDPSPDDENAVRLGLVGLIVMICEAARMEPLLKHIADPDNWNQGKGLTPHLAGLLQNWRNMSTTLLKWKDSSYNNWDSGSCGVDSPMAALEHVALVLKSKNITTQGGAMVEILDVSANLDVGIDSIDIIIDGKQGPVIYTGPRSTALKKKLELDVGDHKYISVCEWFQMKVNASGRIIESKVWNYSKVGLSQGCASPDGADRVTACLMDNNPPKHDGKIAVTYLAMSNAVNATVVVRTWHNHDIQYNYLGLDDEPVDCCKAYGTITARIGGHDDYPIVLFRATEEEARKSSEGMITLQRRSTVHVPRGRHLKIDLGNLYIITTPGSMGKKASGVHTFCFGDSNPASPVVDDGSGVYVRVAWPPRYSKIEPKQESMELNITTASTHQTFIDSINYLRAAFVAGQPKELIHRECRVLSRDSPSGSTKRFVHIRLGVMVHDEKSNEMVSMTTTLAIHDFFCRVAGFKSQNGVWYDVCMTPGSKQRILQEEYNSVPLRWGEVSYHDILDINDNHDGLTLRTELSAINLGKGFAMEAVRVLSRYPEVEEKGGVSPRQALTGLMLMLCESAKFNKLRDHFARAWDAGTGVIDGLNFCYIRNWDLIAETLLSWKRANYEDTRSYHKKLMELGINGGLKGALDNLRLVRRCHRSIDGSTTNE